jgi:hypothetical protein
MHIVAFILRPRVIDRILTHMRRTATAGRLPAPPRRRKPLRHRRQIPGFGGSCVPCIKNQDVRAVRGTQFRGQGEK